MTDTGEIDCTSDIDALASLGALRAFADGAELFAQGEPAFGLYRIISGVVRTSRLAEDGRRQIGDFYFPNDIVGLEDGAEYAFSAEALGRCEAVLLRRDSLECAAASNPDVAAVLLQAALARLQRMQSHLIQLARRSAIERVAAVLAQFAQGEGDIVNLPMSRQDIADYLGLTIETVSRMISQLQASKVIRLTSLRQMRICDRQALRQLAA